MMFRKRQPGEAEATIAFVDLSGFTALTEVHGDEAAANTAERLVSLARRSLSCRDRLVNTTGDGVFLASPDPTHGLAMVGAIFDGWRREPLMPLPRAGLHHGPVLARGRDLYGTTVNVASRLCAVAQPGQVLASETVANASTGPSTALGPRRLRNIRQSVDVFEIPIAATPRGTTTDPVCRMQVCPIDAHGPVARDGTEHWFCSADCALYFRRQAARTEVELR